MPSILWERVAAQQGLLNTATACHCSPALQPGLRTRAGRGSRQSLLTPVSIYLCADGWIWVCVSMQGSVRVHMVGTHRHAGVELTGLVLGLGMAPHSWLSAGIGNIYGCVP